MIYLLGGLLLAAQTAWAQPTVFGEKGRQLKVCNLVITRALTDDNPDPHLWYVADESARLPFSWQLVNPNGPGHLTNTALTRWQAKYTAAGVPFPAGLALGSRLERNYAPYWEIVSDLAQLERLRDYDLIFVHNHSANTLSQAEVQALNLLADCGVTIFIEDCGGMTLSWPVAFPLFDLHGTSMSQNGVFTPATVLSSAATPTFPLHSLFNSPYSLSSFEMWNLGDKTSLGPGTQRLWLTLGLGGLQPLLQAPGAFEPETFLAAGRYGAGNIVVSSLDIGSKINDSIRGGAKLNPDPNENNDGIISGTDFTRPAADPQRRAYDGDFKLLFNILSQGAEWTSFGGNPRRLQSHTDFPGAVLADEWTLQTSLPTAPTPGVGFLIPSPVVANGVVFAVSPSGWLYALDLNPARDLDADGNPDDGLPETDPTAHYDLIWSQNVGQPVVATPAIAHVNWVDPVNGPQSSDIIIVATLAGNVYAYDVSDGTPLWSYTGLSSILSSVSVARGVAYVTDSAGTLTALDLSASMAAGAGVPFASGSLGASTFVAGSGGLALVRDELTGAIDETAYVPGIAAAGQVQAVVTYTSGEKLLCQDQAAGIWYSQRPAFTADSASLIVALDGVFQPQGVAYSEPVPGATPLRIQFAAPPPVTANVQASYKVVLSGPGAGQKWTAQPPSPFLDWLPSPVYSSVGLGSSTNFYLGAGTSPAALYGFKDHGYFQEKNAAGQTINLGVPPARPDPLEPNPLFQVPLPANWGVLASPAVGQDTVVFGLAKDPAINDEGMVVGIAAEPDFTIHLGHSRVAVDNAFLVRDFNAPLTDLAWAMKSHDATNAPNGYQLDAESGAITFSERDAAKRIVVTYNYHYTDATGNDAVAGPVTEYHTLPRLVKWQFPSVGLNLGVPIAAEARVLVVRADGGPYPDPHDAVAEALQIDRLTGFIHLPFPWLGYSFNVFVNDVQVNVSPLTCDYRRDAGVPVIAIGRVTASPLIGGNAVFVDATITYPNPTNPSVFSPVERDIFCLELDPAEGTDLDPDTNSAWATSFDPAFPLNFRKFRHQDDMAIDPDGSGNGAYDLLGVTRSPTIPTYVASPALAEEKLLLASCRPDGTNWYWSLSALGGDLGYLGDGRRLLKLRRDGSAQAEWHSAVQRATIDPVARSVRTDRQPFANPVSAQGLASLGRAGNLFVTDTQNDRLLEMDGTGKILWRLDKSFADVFTDSWGFLAKGEPITLSRPSDAFRSEIPERDVGGLLTGLRSEVTFIADSGNHRALAIQNHFNPATDLYSLPSPDLLWRTDSTQTVYQTVDRAAGGTVILDPATHLPSFTRQKVAGTYQYTSIQPVTLGQANPAGVRWNDAAGLPEFDYAFATVSNFAFDKFPDARFNILESGPGASIALVWGQHFTWDAVNLVWLPDPYAGQVFAAFSGFYRDPAAADQLDPADPALTRVGWGLPYDRVFTQIESVEVSKVREGYPAPGWATLYLTIAGTVARSPFDPSLDPPLPPSGPGVYPITLMIYLGAPPIDPLDYNSASSLLRLHGRPYLSVPPEVLPYAPSYFGLPIWFDQAKYASLMASFAALGSSAYPVQYTGTSGSYAYFRPSSATLSSNGHTYIVVNSHDQKQEVFEWEPALEATGNPTLVMKNISPRPKTYSEGHPTFFGGASGLTRPSAIGRDF